jgi:ribosome-associated protein
MAEAPADDPGIVRLAPGVTVPSAALTFSASRASGPGGQNVNRTESRIEVRLTVTSIQGLSLRAQDRLAVLAGERLTMDGELILTCDETGSQRRNRELVIERLSDLVRDAKAIPLQRRPTRPSYGSVQRRLAAKAHRSQIKKDRDNSDD